MKPTEATLNFVFLVVLISACSVIILIVVTVQHEYTQQLVLEATKLIRADVAESRADIAELRAELKAHDERPYVFERRTNE